MLTDGVGGAKLKAHTPLRSMSAEQLAALLAKLKDDAGIREKLQGAADLDAVVALGREAGFDVSKADWLKYQAQMTLELSDDELEGVVGGAIIPVGINRIMIMLGNYCAANPDKKACQTRQGT